MAKNTKQPRIQTNQAEIGLVLCSIDSASLAEGSNKQSIQLMPVDADGNVTGVDGRSWKLNNEIFMTAVNKAKTDFPIDYEHASLKAPVSGAIAPAAGWIDPASIEIRADGVWGEAAWTDRAANSIRAREFRYTSPVFPFSKGTGEIMGFVGSSLTHYPNLGNQRPVANAQDTQEELAMDLDDLMKQFIYMLNLPITASPDDVKAELQKVIALLSEPVAENAQLGEDPKLTDVVAAVLAHMKDIETAANARGDIDFSQYVPRAEYNALNTRLVNLETAAEDERVETAVNAALQAGKIAPASKDWAIALCRSNPKSFEDFVANTGPAVPLGEHASGGTGAQPQLTQEEIAVCSQMGISTEAYLESKKSEVN